MAFIAHSVIHTFQHHRKQQKELEAENLSTDKKKLSHIQWLYNKCKKDVAELEPDQLELVRIAILDRMVIDPTPQFFLKNGLKWYALSFRELAKGQKRLDS